ncbi:MAG: DUF4861 domain-containing protein [Prevotella sp.]|nr:DUF4861 domain-containing protein [Prevotella sp.]
MRKTLRFLLLTALSATVFQQSIFAQKVQIVISNPGDLQRQEVVETDLTSVCRQLGVDNSTQLVVRNAIGQQMTYQKSYDGKLLLDVTLQPKGTVVYTVSKGQPYNFRPIVQGRVYPERIDDLTWENDRGIYRIYGPELQRRGEKAFGTDVWVKNTPDPVAEYRYKLHMDGWRQGDSLKKAGKKQEGEERFMNTSFHLDHGYGMDVYSVGPSLGCGAPALMKDGQLVFPYCWQQCKILDNGPLRFTAELTYGTTAEGTTEHRLISLDKGSHFNKMTVWYDGIRKPTSLASGVVLHSTDNIVIHDDYVLYADPTDNPKVHQSQIFVGTLFPEGVSKTTVLEGKLNHAIGIVNNYKGQRYTYYFGSAWSLYDMPTIKHWQLKADEFLLGLKQKLAVHIKAE